MYGYLNNQKSKSLELDFDVIMGIADVLSQFSGNCSPVMRFMHNNYLFYRDETSKNPEVEYENFLAASSIMAAMGIWLLQTGVIKVNVSIEKKEST